MFSHTTNFFTKKEEELKQEIYRTTQIPFVVCDMISHYVFSHPEYYRLWVAQYVNDQLPLLADLLIKAFHDPQSMVTFAFDELAAGEWWGDFLYYAGEEKFPHALAYYFTGSQYWSYGKFCESNPEEQKLSSTYPTSLQNNLQLTSVLYSIIKDRHPYTYIFQKDVTGRISQVKALLRSNRHINLTRQYLGFDFENGVLQCANLREAYFSTYTLKPNYRGIALLNWEKTDFSHSSFYKAKFHHVSFSGANFSYTDLSFVDCGCDPDFDSSSISFQQAHFICANLHSANLKKCDLSRGNFSDANLQFANLEKAILRNTDFSTANLQFANLKECDLTQTRLPLNVSLLAGVNFLNAKILSKDKKRIQKEFPRILNTFPAEALHPLIRYFDMDRTGCFYSKDTWEVHVCALRMIAIKSQKEYQEFIKEMDPFLKKNTPFYRALQQTLPLLPKEISLTPPQSIFNKRRPEKVIAGLTVYGGSGARPITIST